MTSSDIFQPSYQFAWRANLQTREALPLTDTTDSSSGFRIGEVAKVLGQEIIDAMHRRCADVDRIVLSVGRQRSPVVIVAGPPDLP